MGNTFVIDVKLPSLNEVIAKNRTNRYAGAKYKKDIEAVIGWAIRQALITKTLHSVTTPCIIEMEWHEATKRRDVDNIQSSQKFILDAMVENRIIPDDSRKYVKQIYHQIIDDDSDFVVVKIKSNEVEK